MKVRNIESYLGSNITVNCTVKGAPTPYVSWHDKDDTDVSKQDNVKMLSNGNLFIESIQVKNTGKYICKAQNQFGEAKAEVLITAVGLGMYQL